MPHWGLKGLREREMHPGPLTLIKYSTLTLSHKVRVCPVKEGRVFGIVYKVF